MSPLVWCISCVLVGIVFIINMSSGGVQQPVVDCNGQPRQMSVYEQYCCQYSNRGKSFERTSGPKLHTIIICPNECPRSCFVLFNSSLCTPPPPADCTEVLSANSQATSGFYEIRSNGSETVSVYCDMEGVNCDGEGGWTRVAYLNMTQQDAICPSGLYQQDYNNIDHPVCGRSTTLYTGGCATHVYSTLGIEYSKVCGRVRGYRYGTIDGVTNEAVSIVLTSSSTHVWTFRAIPFNGCSCSTSYDTTIGYNYFCEHWSGHVSPTYFDVNPLWDGQQCISSNASTGCTRIGTIPWFLRCLNPSKTITEDLRFSICLDERYSNEDIPVDIIEIFVK